MKALWFSFIRTQESRRYPFSQEEPHHDPHEYDEHVLMDFLSQFQYQGSDGLELVQEIADMEADKRKEDLLGNVMFTKELCTERNVQAVEELHRETIRYTVGNVPGHVIFRLFKVPGNDREPREMPWLI